MSAVMASTPLTPLAALQRAFAQGLCGDDPAPALALLRPLCQAPPRLAAYRHAYRARLVAALRSNYPVLHRSLGDDDFDALALRYLAAQPSRHPSIRWFGHTLVPHLQAQTGEAALHPALVDLARMEWALCLSFDAADAAPLSAADLASLPAADWPALRVRPHPSLRLLQLQWAVAPLWRALTDDPLATAPEPLAQPHALLVWRRGLDTLWRTLEPPEAQVLGTACEGQPFGAWCELAAQQAGADAAAATVVRWLHQWLVDGLFVAET